MRIAYWILAALICAPGSPGQSPATGGLTGTVTTRSGAGIPHATVRLTHSATSQAQTIPTSSTGAFSFSLLAPGTYEVRFASPGFKTARLPSISLTPPKCPVLDATLEEGEAAEPVSCRCRITTPAPPTARSSIRGRSPPSP